ICDVGLLPEGDMHRRSGSRAPYDMGHDPAEYPFAAVYEMADLASSLQPDAMPRLTQGLAHSDSAVRYWAVLGLLMRGPEAVATGRDGLLKALDDSSPDVRIAAAETLGRYGSAADLSRALSLLGKAADWSRNDVFTAIAAINALTALGDKAAPLAPTLAALPTQGVSPDPRYKDYVPRLLGSLRTSLAADHVNPN
ncbi:MAG TPA: HEAT repeat domain-containing protein, partial [Pirellulales bacterium]|nr:HEAT repeat domain-containing protein [Pirellulales bacterium]